MAMDINRFMHIYQSVGNRGVNCVILNHKVRTLCHQDVIVVSVCHHIMVFSTEASQMCLLHARMSFHDVGCS